MATFPRGALVALALVPSCALACASADAPSAPIVAFVGALDTGGEVLAAWSVARAPCDGLAPVDCARVARERDSALWDRWDAVAMAWGAYRAGGEIGPVVDAYCALLPVLPADAPKALVVPGVCP